MTNDATQLKAFKSAVERLKLDKKTGITDNDVTMLRDFLMELGEFGLASMVHEMRTAADLEDFIKDTPFV